MSRSILRLFFVALVGGVSGCGAAPAVVNQNDVPPGQNVADNPECRSNVDCDDGLFCNGRERCRGVTCEDGERPCGNGACDEAGNLCVADEPEPSDHVLPSGTFIGRADCRNNAVVGGLTETDFPSSPLVINIDDSGMIVVGGVQIEVGAVLTNDFGAFHEEIIITSVVETSNGVTVNGDYFGVWDCGDSCAYRNDGVCDEINFCDLGTDCSDCGPIFLSGSFSSTYRPSGGAIEYVSSSQSGDPDGFIALTSSCLALLE